MLPPGDRGVVPIVSTSRDEAAQRLRLVRAILGALQVAFREDSDAIELLDSRGRPVAFKVYTASIAGVSGFTSVGALCDEAAKWRDAATGANPAREVLATLRPTLAGQPSARLFLISSPLGLQDAHATAFDLGDTDFQLTEHSTTWEANPTITEAETHALEPMLAFIPGSTRLSRRPALWQPSTRQRSSALSSRGWRRLAPPVSWCSIHRADAATRGPGQS